MRAEGTALVVVHRVLEQRAENFRLNLGPVERGGFAEQDEFEALNFQPRGLGETSRR